VPELKASTSRRLTSAQALALWEELRRTGDPAVRDRMVLTFAPLVKYIVFRKVREMPVHCDVEDLISCGLEALLQSIDRFDPEQGTTLEQYAWTRIHGAVLDELRRQDWAPRSVRRRERDRERAADAFSAVHGRRPRPHELADALNLSVDELKAHDADVARSDVTSLNALVMDDDSGVERMDTLVDASLGTNPEAASTAWDAKSAFRAAFARLPRREREVAVLLYVKHLTLAEIGEVLGVSESRVCQIHGGLKRALRQALQADAALFEHVA
jgi:RNA polymerase sigma factor for flagellar operon FliA